MRLYALEQGLRLLELSCWAVQLSFYIGLVPERPER